MPEASPITTSVTYLISSARGWNIGIGRRSRQSSFPQLPLSQQRSSISSTPRNLYEHNELYQWRTTGSGDVSDGPRRKCIIMSNVDGDDRVLRGELVMIFSFMGPHHGRVLIAHYDGTKLIVRKSELLDFKDPSSFKTRMPWRFSSGVGDTTAI
ncbi:hypothetical protein N7475_008035 [Penicillium sp. IBT 31633x]|nr:hypothetical protein N7475_008035 [Penicillium sp. IBT 31633x]